MCDFQGYFFYYFPGPGIFKNFPGGVGTLTFYWCWRLVRI